MQKFLLFKNYKIFKFYLCGCCCCCCCCRCGCCCAGSWAALWSILDISFVAGGRYCCSYSSVAAAAVFNAVGRWFWQLLLFCWLCQQSLLWLLLCLHLWTSGRGGYLMPINAVLWGNVACLLQWRIFGRGGKGHASAQGSSAQIKTIIFVLLINI